MKSFSETAEEELMLKIAIIIGSTRPGRNGEAVAKWVYEVAKKRSDAEFELVDIKDFNLPLLDEPMPPIMGQYSFLFAEWNNKAAGFVSYGGASGARAVEQLRLNLAEVQMATVRLQVLLSMYSDFENFSVFKPDSRKETSVNDMLDQVTAWGGALKTLRKKTA
jgi:NAD(P)H-dependent FMN reductase